MKYIIKLSPEIIIKSKAVRKKTIKLLSKNIRSYLKQDFEDFSVTSLWDRVDLEIDYKDKKEFLEKTLKSIFWIDHFLEVLEYDLDRNDLDKQEQMHFVFEKARELNLDKIEWKSFCVRVNRTWKHDFWSIDLERYIWGGLLKFSNNSKVKLKDPDFTVKIEIKEDKVFLIKNRFTWAGWYPTWFQDKVLSLISGWFDSTVASYQVMKRWTKTDFLFFNLWWWAHEMWVKQVSYYLWKNFEKPYKAKFLTIDFSMLIEELVKNSAREYRAILLKRYMLKVASTLESRWYLSLVKWDSLWQVSSQTLKNMNAIDKASSMLILRPLISQDKQEIIDISKKIWTYSFAANMPEYCWVVSDKPKTAAKIYDIEKQEEKIDPEIVEKLLDTLKIEKIEEVLESQKKQTSLENAYLAGENEIIVDLREEHDIKKSPLILDTSEVLSIGFHEINHRFKDLDQTKTYLFYCKNWTLSNLHGLYLKEKWFNNIKLYKHLWNSSKCELEA